MPLHRRRQGALHQTNHYNWADGKTEVRDFPTTYLFGRIIFDNELIYGWCSEIPEDDHHRTLMLYWQRKGEEGLELYEMIQLSDCGTLRNRVWHSVYHQSTATAGNSVHRSASSSPTT